MNREIKFRTWDETPKKDGFKGLMITHEYLMQSSYLINGLSGNYPIMQYTGLKDKNGVEIYEGDILLDKSILINIDKNKKVPNSEHENWYEVFWSKEYSAWNLKKIKTTRFGNFGLGNVDWFKISIKTEGSEVVGNIHENPELL